MIVHDQNANRVHAWRNAHFSNKCPAPCFDERGSVLSFSNSSSYHQVMFRKDLIPMLLQYPMTVTEIARFVEQSGKDTLEDLQHLLQSLKHTEYKAVVEPATCRKCDFEF